MVARRAVIKGVASLPLAAVLADAGLAQAAAARLETVSLTTAGGRWVAAALAVPAAEPAPAIMRIHEWWGLNDQIRAVAAEFAAAGTLALAIDLYDGEVAHDSGAAQGLMRGLDDAQATDTLASWIAWLRDHAQSNGKVATVGWCFGGGWSLNASLAARVEATVIYYGNVAKKAADLAPLQGPVLGHFASRDRFIDEAMVAGFAAEMEKAGKSLTAYWYEADHAFANPTGARYDEADTQLAWARTLEFLETTL